jgi:hypothetical protein
MELLKKYRIILLIVLPVLILVLIRAAGLNHFKSDSKKWAAPSLVHSNIINTEQAIKLEGNKLILCINKTTPPEGIKGNIQNFTPDSLLDRRLVSMILKNDGPVLLNSLEPALSARIWMLLSQLGCRNIYILGNNSDNEVLKYQLHSDTTSRAIL